jgi:hypothetical protein
MRTLLRTGSLFTALLLLIQVSAASGQRDVSLGDAAVGLNHVTFFAIGGTGYAGRISEGELDYKAILSQPPESALKVFERVYSVGSPAARSYALLGIQKLAPARFMELYASVKNSTEPVETMEGCIVSTAKISMIAKRIHDYYYYPKSTGALLQQ